MTEDAKAILLLCGRFFSDGSVKPLEDGEYNQVARWLIQQRQRPADLLHSQKLIALATETGIAQDRLGTLLGRGVQLGFAVEGWNRSGIWVLCRSDPHYPARYKSHLKEKAPPVLFGAGDQSLLKGGGLAIVGSRNADSEAEAFTRDVAASCAAGRVPVVSGGARGVDQFAMSSALEGGGITIGVLADGLLRVSVSHDARYSIAAGRLLLISPNHPEAGFNVGTAMSRNKLIYAMADYGLVISAEYNKGGTWAGAVEELKRAGGRPIFVRLTGNVPSGNRKLQTHGAIECPVLGRNGDHRDVLGVFNEARQQSVHVEPEPSLFGGSPGDRNQSLIKDSTSIGTAPTTASMASPAAGIYNVVLPVILNALVEPRTAEELARQLDVSKVQLGTWLKRAISEEKVQKRGKPVRYEQRKP